MTRGQEKIFLLILVLGAAGYLVVFGGRGAVEVEVVEEDAPRDFRVAEPAGEKGDDLTTAVRSLLERVVNGEGATEAELVRQLVEALDREEVGVAEFRQDAATDVVFGTLEAAREFDGVSRKGSEEMRQQALRQQATMLVQDLYMATEHDVAEMPTNFGPLLEGHHLLSWERLTDADYKEGDPLPEEVRSLNGQRVAVTGFLMDSGYGELILVKALWSCCFGAPPEVHEVVVVSMDGPPEDAWFYGAVRVVGTLEVGEEREDGLLLSIYRMRARQVDLPR